ncbi:MAG TPA: plastocyanin/azurin family copper-binding protein [Gaiellaceae bacterium]|jgi:plastocyanin
MRRAAIAFAGLVALAGALPGLTATTQVREVSMPGKVFAPGVLQVLVGETVVWRNADSINHTVTSDSDQFDSGFIAPGLTFARVFEKTGRYAYHCSIHRFMTGDVVVVPVALAAPRDPVISGGRVVLQGLAPSGTRRVVVQKAGERGRVVARVAPAGDGSFAVPLRVFRPEDLVARARGRASPRVHVAVSPRVRVRRQGAAVVAVAKPARRGARAVLQRYDRERFAWSTLTRGRLDAGSRVEFRLPEGAGRFRVVVRGDGSWADGASGPVVVR